MFQMRTNNWCTPAALVTIYSLANNLTPKRGQKIRQASGRRTPALGRRRFKTDTAKPALNNCWPVGTVANSPRRLPAAAGGRPVQVNPFLPGGQARVHHLKPQGRHQCQDNHRGVAKRQLGALIVMIQHLVTLDGMRMVVGVTLELKQKKIAHQVARIPRVQRVYPFVPPIGQLPAHNAVVLDVVHQLQQRKCKKTLNKKEQRNGPVYFTAGTEYPG